MFAVPGSIHSPVAKEGCHRLIREGAKLVETAADITRGTGHQKDRSATLGSANGPADDLDPILAALGLTPAASTISPAAPASPPRPLVDRAARPGARRARRPLPGGLYQRLDDGPRLTGDCRAAAGSLCSPATPAAEPPCPIAAPRCILAPRPGHHQFPGHRLRSGKAASWQWPSRNSPALPSSGLGRTRRRDIWRNQVARNRRSPGQGGPGGRRTWLRWASPISETTGSGNAGGKPLAPVIVRQDRRTVGPAAGAVPISPNSSPSARSVRSHGTGLKHAWLVYDAPGPGGVRTLLARVHPIPGRRVRLTGGRVTHRRQHAPRACSSACTGAVGTG